MIKEIERFITYCRVERGFASGTTISQYTVDLIKFCDILKIDSSKKLLNLDKDDIEKYLYYLSTQNYSPATYNKRLSTLKSFFNFLIDEEIISRNPMRRFKTKKIKSKQKRVLTVDEANSIVGATTNLRDKTLIMLYLGAGMRVSEVTSIKVEDLRESSNEIFIIRKGGKEQYVQIPQSVMEQIKVYRNEYRNIKMKELGLNDTQQPLLFFSFRGNKIKSNSLNGALKNIAKKAGILDFNKIHNHTFRTSYATQMHRDGVSDKALQEQLGHNNISTTLGSYVQIDNEQIRNETKGKGFIVRKDEEGGI